MECNSLDNVKQSQNKKKTRKRKIKNNTVKQSTQVEITEKGWIFIIFLIKSF